MIVAGMNALVRRSCTWTPVRALATTAKPEGSGKKHWHRNNKKRKEDKAKPQAGTKPEPKAAHVAKTAPVIKTVPTIKNAPIVKAAPEPEPTQTQSAPQNGEKRPHVPLPTPNPPLSAYTLPPSKLRALIDLYHSSTGFITPETLSSVIDDTFAPRRYIANTSTRYQSYQDLIAQRDELDTEPDRVVPNANELGGRGFGTADSLAGELMAGTWSTSKAERVRMVKAALWGVDPMARIGLETLLEAKVELDTQEKQQEQEQEKK